MTPESVQAMIDQALLRNSTNGDGIQSSQGDNPRNVQTTRPCFYADFMKCHPLNFKGNEGVVSFTRWIKKMESVFNICGCAIENQVKFATCTLLDAALTWWNGEIRTLGPEAYAMTWEFVANENEKIDKYISGLLDSIYGIVKSSKPRTLDETIELTNELMDQKLRTYAKRADNKRKADDTSRNNHGHNQQPFKKQNVAKVYNIGTRERKPYEGSLPKCTKCQCHHNGPRTQKCHKCNKVGYFARDCRSSGNANVANAQRDGKETPKGSGNDGVVSFTRWIKKMESVFNICGCAIENQFVANENEKIDKYISGLLDSIYGIVKSSKPRTLDETIELTNDLMDQKLRTYAKRADNKRKADDTSRNNHGHNQQPFKK
nr:hypothetical protein [Tanacetum cinerariifolium]